MRASRAPERRDVWQALGGHRPCPGYEAFTARYGDLHNHCDLSYGRGTPQDALANARLQLDFVRLTVHGAWPDVPTADPDLGYLFDDHRSGFEPARAGGAGYLQLTEAANDPGRFVTLPSFEWHAMAYGDHCVYLRDAAGSRIVDAPDLSSLRAELRALPAPTLLIPHHVAYRPGYRGIDGSAFEPELSPVVEIVSFHGAPESCDGPLPYLHAMGPRHEHGTARHVQRGARRPEPTRLGTDDEVTAHVQRSARLALDPRRCRGDLGRTPSWRSYLSAPEGQRSTMAATSAAPASPTTIQGFLPVSNTAGSPRRQAPTWTQRRASKETVIRSPR